MDFCEKLQLLRKEKSITQEDLAEKLCVSRQAVSKWESNQTMPEIDKIKEISKIFSVSLDYLLTDKSENENFDKEKTPVKTGRIGVNLILGVTFFLAGFIGVLIFYVLFIVENIFSQFNDFLDSHSLWFIFIICCLLLVVGLFLMFKTLLMKLAKAYIRQNIFLKIGIPALPIGLIASYLFWVQSLKVLKGYDGDLLLDFLSRQTMIEFYGMRALEDMPYNPETFLKVSLVLSAIGLFLTTIGIIIKIRNKRKNK